MHKAWMDALWLVILCALLAIMGWLLHSGDILIYLSPRMVPMVWFGCAVLLALLVYHGMNVARALRQKQRGRGGRLGMLLFLVPVLLFATVTPNQTTTGGLPNQTVKMVGLNEADAAGEMKPAEIMGELPPCVVELETSHFDSASDIFTDYLYQTLGEVIGKTITVYGFVYREDTFPENTVLVSRMMISCCAADASVVGFYVKLDDATALQDNEWIRVTGTVRSVNLPYYGTRFDFPILTDGIIVRCDTPEVDKAYVYPKAWE